MFCGHSVLVPVIIQCTHVAEHPYYIRGLWVSWQPEKRRILSDCCTHYLKLIAPFV